MEERRGSAHSPDAAPDHGSQGLRHWAMIQAAGSGRQNPLKYKAELLQPGPIRLLRSSHGAYLATRDFAISLMLRDTGERNL
jgi:hypothetical protein